jgi:hypothetical protein
LLNLVAIAFAAPTPTPPTSAAAAFWLVVIARFIIGKLTITISRIALIIVIIAGFNRLGFLRPALILPVILAGL